MRAPSAPDRISPETLAHLRWLANSPLSIAVVDKPVLKLLVETYARTIEAECHGMRIVGSLSSIVRRE